MLAEERQRRILQEVKRRRAAKVFELSKLFDVSEMTIRRDLEKLDAERLIQRAYGGALSVEGTALEPTFQEKESVNIKEKERIGVAAASIVTEGNTICLSTGTTTMQIIKNLATKKITVVTNSLNNAFELSKLSNVRLSIIGGELRAGSYAMVGSHTGKHFRQLYVDKLFLGVNGFSIEHGLTTPNPSEAEICRVMIEIAKETIVVADHTKLESVSFAKIANIECVDKLITDSDVDEKYVKQLREREIEVTIV